MDVTQRAAVRTSSVPPGRGVVGWLRRHTDRPVRGPAGTPIVAIIGSGFAGLNMAIRLRQCGVESFTVYEREQALGGTWRDNAYPGAACDVPSHLYCYSFEPKADWSRKFATQSEILEYLEHCADRYGVRSHIQFGVAITAATWDDERGRWRLRTSSGEDVEADVVVACTGQLNQPLYPNLPGRDEFGGSTFHSARWDHDHDLAGEDVGVVGTGASAIQFVPEVAKVARSVTIFQRSAPYVAPKPDGEFSAKQIRRFAHLPGWERLYRWSVYWRFEARFALFLRNSPVGRRFRELLTRWLRKSVVSDDLPESAVVPDYPVGCNRILISNDWYSTLKANHVRIVTTPIREMKEHSIVTVDGEYHPADTVIYGTGFQATNFLGDLRVIGRYGARLADVWSGGARAHLGITVTGFPNLFILYGPNTNLGHNSVLFMLERQVEYVLQCLRVIALPGIAALDVKPEVMSRSDRRTQSRLARTVWAQQCRSWYKTATGRITQNWSGPTIEYWLAAKRVRLADFHVVRPRVAALSETATSAGAPAS